MKTWKKYAPQLIPSLSPLASILWHPRFHRLLQLDDFKNWRQGGLEKFGTLGKNREMHSSAVIVQKLGDTARVQLQHNQVQSLVLAMLREGNPFRPRTAFKELLVGHKKKKSIKIYKMLPSCTDYIEKAKTQWEKDLATTWTEEEWVAMKKLNLTCSSNIAITENRQKVLNRWHLTPGSLCKMFPNSDGKCWWCKCENADHLHIWWECDKLQPFWSQIHDYLQQIFQNMIPRQSKIMLVVDIGTVKAQGEQAFFGKYGSSSNDVNNQ